MCTIKLAGHTDNLPVKTSELLSFRYLTGFITTPAGVTQAFWGSHIRMLMRLPFLDSTRNGLQEHDGAGSILPNIMLAYFLIIDWWIQILFQHMPNHWSAIPHSTEMTNTATGEDVKKNREKHWRFDTVPWLSTEWKPYFMVLNSGFPMQDLGQRNAVTPAGSNCPITPGSRLLQVRSRVCQSDSSNLGSRILLISKEKSYLCVQLQKLSRLTKDWEEEKPFTTI